MFSSGTSRDTGDALRSYSHAICPADVLASAGAPHPLFTEDFNMSPISAEFFFSCSPFLVEMCAVYMHPTAESWCAMKLTVSTWQRGLYVKHGFGRPAERKMVSFLGGQTVDVL